MMGARALPIERAEETAEATAAPSLPARVGAFAFREGKVTRIVEPGEKGTARARSWKGGGEVGSL